MKPPPGGEVRGVEARVAISATTVTSGIASFHTTVDLVRLARASGRPCTLMTREHQHQHRRDDVALRGQHRPSPPEIVVSPADVVRAKYCSAASTSIGAVVTAPRKANQPPAKPTEAAEARSAGSARCRPRPGTRRRARRARARAASSPRRRAPTRSARPGRRSSRRRARRTASPTPMIEPTETNISEVSPTSRRSLPSSGAAGVPGRFSRWVATAIVCLPPLVSIR